MTDLQLDTQVGTAYQAKFNPLIRPYLVVYVAFVLACTVVGLPLALLWVMGIGQWWARHYFEKLECVLDHKTLRYRKGIIVQVEKTIPLENIQDVTFVEGPVLRRFHLSIVKFETAGQSAGQAHDMQLVGIIDAHDFRNKILDAREALKLRSPDAQTKATPELAVLQGIEQRLEEIVELLKRRDSSS